MGWDIGIYSTYNLDQKWAGDARVAAKQYIKRNLNETAYSIDRIEVRNETPRPPSEKVFWDTNYDDIVCSTEKTYAAMTDWWYDWLNCNLSDPDKYKDGAILLTNAEGTAGVKAGNCPSTSSDPLKMIVEASDIGALLDTGQDVGRSYDGNREYSQMFAGVLHELGHACMKDTNYAPYGTCTGNPDTWQEEYMAYSENRNVTWVKTRTGESVNEDLNVTTPMVTWGNNRDQNECCKTLEYNDANYGAFERSWSGCVFDFVEPC